MSERYPKNVPVFPDDPVIEKGEDICANCSHCLAVCAEETGVAQPCKATGADGSICIHCGQCVATCPERIIHAKSQWREAAMAVNDQQKIATSSTAPSVYMRLGECFGGKPEGFMKSYMISVLRKLGADFVLDVVFSADLIITEEGTELLKRFIADSHPLPQLTSCYPAWIKYIETFHLERTPCLFSTKSPISMQDALIKACLSKERRIDPRWIVNTTVTPCTAKKFGVPRGELCSTGAYLGTPGFRDNGYMLTIRELAEWIREAGTGFYGLTPSVFNSFMGEGSGAGVTFGNIGGVIEVALHMVYSVVSGIEPPDLLMRYQPVRGLGQVKESVVSPNGYDVRTAIVYGTRAAEQLIATGAVDDYDFMEVTTCPGGCISGGGQSDSSILPAPDQPRMTRVRSPYLVDQERSFRNSLESQEIKYLYETSIGESMSRMV